MTTQLSTKLAALAVALMVNGMMIGGVAYLFNGSLHQHAAVLSLAHAAAAPRRWSGMGERGRLREQFLGRKSQPIDDRQDVRPFLVKESFPLAGQEQPARTVAHEHAAAAALLDQAFIDQLLIPFENGEWIEPVVGGDRADGGQWIALLQRTLQDEGNHSITQLAIDGLVVVPVRVHSPLVPCPCTGHVAR